MRTKFLINKNHDPDAQAIFAKIAQSLVGNTDVTFNEGKGFGSNALKTHGKIFAMISSGCRLTVKLPAARAAQIVEDHYGEYFDPGHGRKMKQWVELVGALETWPGIVEEARRYVGNGK